VLLLHAVLILTLAPAGSQLDLLLLCRLAGSCCVWCPAVRHSSAAATSCYHWQLSSQHKLLLVLVLVLLVLVLLLQAAHVQIALCSCGCCCSCAVRFQQQLQQQQQQRLKAPALHAVLLRHP
jgi:hypothetical protein